MAEFSDFTKLVLDRMDTNPEEFASINGGYNRWQGLVNGLEELARGDTDGRFIKVLWPLSEHERAVLLEKYRKIYLAELHKDMLKNIVSGNDKEAPRTYSYSNDINPLKGQVLRGAPTTLLTATAMQEQSVRMLNDSFDDSFAKVSVKAEGTAINPVRSKYQTVKLNRAQLLMADSMGISAHEYARRLAQHEASNND